MLITVVIYKRLRAKTREHWTIDYFDTSQSFGSMQCTSQRLGGRVAFFAFQSSPVNATEQLNDVFKKAESTPLFTCVFVFNKTQMMQRLCGYMATNQAFVCFSNSVFIIIISIFLRGLFILWPISVPCAEPCGCCRSLKIQFHAWGRLTSNSDQRWSQSKVNCV